LSFKAWKAVEAITTHRLKHELLLILVSHGVRLRCLKQPLISFLAIIQYNPTVGWDAFHRPLVRTHHP
ncbi:MAG: hypothetical protein MUQ10_18100, partial [Anaerolineae bacterium]|nr:hypothetical protein [Anaerolineae bacterium]